MKDKKNFKMVLDKLGRGLEIFFVILIIMFCIITLCQRIFSKNNSFFGYRIFNIVTKSMEPELKVGDVILVKDTNPKDIKRGDNITYQGMSDDLKGKIITHQVKNYIDENNKRIFYTQGVNSSVMDPAVYEDQVYGVVEYKFIILSIINKIITNSVGFVLFVLLPLVYIFVMELKTIAEERVKAREKEKKLEETMEIL